MTVTRKELDIGGNLLSALPPVIRAIRAAMRDIGGTRFTVPQFRVLGFLSLQSGTGKQLAEWHGVSLPAMSRMVGQLVRRKLVVRTRDTTDRRQVQLKLSAKGRGEFNRLHKAIETRLAERIADLDEAKKQALGAGLLVLGELFRGL